MKQITLNIPDKEYDFFINLMKKFNFIKVKEADFVIPEEHKQEVRKRRKTAGKMILLSGMMLRNSFSRHITTFHFFPFFFCFFRFQKLG